MVKSHQKWLKLTVPYASIEHYASHQAFSCILLPSFPNPCNFSSNLATCSQHLPQMPATDPQFSLILHSQILLYQAHLYVDRLTTQQLKTKTYTDYKIKPLAY